LVCDYGQLVALLDGPGSAGTKGGGEFANKCFGVADISIFDAGAEILFSCHPVHAFHDASQDGIIMLLGLWTLTSSSSGQM
jgi:hypothetical protein